MASISRSLTLWTLACVLATELRLYAGLQTKSPYFFFLVGGKGGNASCTVRPKATWDSSTAYQWVFSPVGQICRLTYPLKPSYAGEPGHIPLRESTVGPVL